MPTEDTWISLCSMRFVRGRPKITSFESRVSNTSVSGRCGGVRSAHEIQQLSCTQAPSRWMLSRKGAGDFRTMLSIPSMLSKKEDRTFLAKTIWEIQWLQGSQSVGCQLSRGVGESWGIFVLEQSVEPVNWFHNWKSSWVCFGREGSKTLICSGKS